MNKIINRRKYDTSTAEYLGSYQYSAPGDFHYTYEGLYRTKAGEFFLHAEGGPASKYAKPAGQNWYSGDETIIPLSISKAQEWAEGNLSSDDYEKIFGEVKEDETKTLIPLMISTEAIEKLTEYANRYGKERSEVVESLLMSLNA